MVVALVAGCGTDNVPLPEESLEKASREAGKTIIRSVKSSGGSLDKISDSGSRLKQWSISWESASLEYTSEQEFGGRMRSVRGTVYENGVEASTFVANEAVANRGTSTLQLLGGVIVKSKRPDLKGSLYCAEMAYDGITATIEAKKQIRVEYDTYILSGLNHIKANADLSVVATPDMYSTEAVAKR